MPTVSKAESLTFMEAISQMQPDALHLVIWDGVGFHPKGKEEGVPANIRLLKLSAYSPELNPVEGVGDEIKDCVCNKCYEMLEALEDAIVEQVQDWLKNGERVAQRIFAWLKEKAALFREKLKEKFT